jgi:prepilin-type processing-associated H-X9-DG protein
LTCQNNLAQLAKAVNAYESRLGRYPGYSNRLKISSNNDEAAGAVAWTTVLLADLERNDLLEEWKDGRAATGHPYLELFTCPEDPPLEKNDGWTSYVANAGMHNKDARECGVFHDYYDQGLFTSVDQVSGADGTTTTVLLSENVQAANWYLVSEKDQSNPKAYNIFVFWNIPTNQFDNSRFQSIGINGNVDELAINDASLTSARPSSFHTGGGVNIAFCDTHVTFLREDIDYGVYGQLMTPDGKRCPARPYFRVPLNDKDYR